MPAYASGILMGRAESVIRRHLTSGCRGCLEALFRHPVGLPRDRPPERPPDDGTWGVVAAVLVVIALTGTVLASTMWRDDRPARPGGDGRARRRVAALEARVQETRGLLASLSARAGRLEVEVGALARPLAAGVPRSMTGPSRQGGRPGAGAEQALGRLGSSLASRATRVARLRAQATAAGARGWVVWDPLRRRLFVYAVGLPALVTPWEALVSIGDDARRAPLRRLQDGGAWVALEPIPERGCRAGVVVVPPGADRVVLRGDLDVCAGAPAA